MTNRIAISTRAVARSMFERGYSIEEVQAFIDKHQLSSGYIYADLIPIDKRLIGDGMLSKLQGLWN